MAVRSVVGPAGRRSSASPLGPPPAVPSTPEARPASPERTHDHLPDTMFPNARGTLFGPPRIGRPRDRDVIVMLPRRDCWRGRCRRDGVWTASDGHRPQRRHPGGRARSTRRSERGGARSGWTSWPTGSRIRPFLPGSGARPVLGAAGRGVGEDPRSRLANPWPVRRLMWCLRRFSAGVLKSGETLTHAFTMPRSARSRGRSSRLGARAIFSRGRPVVGRSGWRADDHD